MRRSTSPIQLHRFLAPLSKVSKTATHHPEYQQRSGCSSVPLYELSRHAEWTAVITDGDEEPTLPPRSRARGKQRTTRTSTARHIASLTIETIYGWLPVANGRLWAAVPVSYTAEELLGQQKKTLSDDDDYVWFYVQFDTPVVSAVYASSEGDSSDWITGLLPSLERLRRQTGVVVRTSTHNRISGMLIGRSNKQHTDAADEVMTWLRDAQTLKWLCLGDGPKAVPLWPSSSQSLVSPAFAGATVIETKPLEGDSAEVASEPVLASSGGVLWRILPLGGGGLNGPFYQHTTTDTSLSPPPAEPAVREDSVDFFSDASGDCALDFDVSQTGAVDIVEKEEPVKASCNNLKASRLTGVDLSNCDHHSSSESDDDGDDNSGNHDQQEERLIQSRERPLLQVAVTVGGHLDVETEDSLVVMQSMLNEVSSTPSIALDASRGRSSASLRPLQSLSMSSNRRFPFPQPPPRSGSVYVVLCPVSPNRFRSDKIPLRHVPSVVKIQRSCPWIVGVHVHDVWVSVGQHGVAGFCDSVINQRVADDKATHQISVADVRSLDSSQVFRRPARQEIQEAMGGVILFRLPWNTKRSQEEVETFLMTDHRLAKLSTTVGVGGTFGIRHGASAPEMSRTRSTGNDPIFSMADQQLRSFQMSELLVTFLMEHTIKLPRWMLESFGEESAMVSRTG